jgi:enoyl ACP reductase
VENAAGVQLNDAEIKLVDSYHTLASVLSEQRDQLAPFEERNALKALAALWQIMNDLDMEPGQLYPLGAYTAAMLLEKKRLLITGVLTDKSIAFEAARVAQEQGAEILLTSFGRAMAVTKRSVRRLPEQTDVLEMDVNDGDQLEAVASEIKSRWGSLDGFLHAIAFAPPDALGGNFMATPWASAAVALPTSAYSLKALAAHMRPLMDSGGSIVSLDFDASVAWPIYDWMGVSKAALEAVTRDLARDLGGETIRVNCVSSGPLSSMAAKAMPWLVLF